MNPVVAQQALDEYDDAAQRISRHVERRIGRNVIDAQARTQDDYLQDLRLRAIETAETFQRVNGFCLPAERRYVHKSLWNRARDWTRTHILESFKRHDTSVEFLSEDKTNQWYDPEPQLEAIHALRQLEVRLPTEQWHVLREVAEAGGCVLSAYNASPHSCCQRSYHDRFQAAQEAAKKILRP